MTERPPHHHQQEGEAGVMRTRLDQQLYDKNLAFFADNFPLIAIRLRGIRSPQSFLFHPGDDPNQLDLMVEGAPFFADDVRRLARDDVANLIEARLFMNHLPLASLIVDEEAAADAQQQAHVDMDNHLYAQFRQFCQTHAVDVDRTPRDTCPAQVLVVGIGLGCVLEELVNAGRVKTIAVLEENLESLHHSMFVIDYAALHQRHTDDGGLMRIEIIDADDTAVEIFSDFFRYHHFSYLAGGRVLWHNRRLFSQKFAQAFLKRMFMGLASKGFFIDQVIMLRQQAENLYRRATPLLLATSAKPPRVPCFVVGNGPSLNHSAAVIKKFADQVVIISCGSALGSLLARGIKPDFHVETENTLPTEKIILKMAERYDLSGIHLWQSTTVRSRVAACFDEASAFSRSGIAPFSPKAQRKLSSLPNCEPTVGNAGVAIAAKIGFSAIYLFGLDMGTTDKGQFHASGGVYDDEELQRYGLEKRHALPELIPVPQAANFGGLAYSSDITLFAIPYIEAAAKTMKSHYLVQLFNCSDGVRLDHFVPLLPETLELDTTPELKRHTLEAIKQRTLPIEEVPGARQYFCALYDPELVRETFAFYRQKIQDEAEPVAENTDFPLFRLLAEFEKIFERRAPYDDSSDFHFAVHYTVSGSFYRWSQLYVSCDANIPVHLRDALAKEFLAFLEKMLGIMEAELLGVCREVADIRAQYMAEWGITPVAGKALIRSIINPDKV